VLSQAVTPSALPRFPELGERFGTFRLRSILGQGGAARVYLAQDDDLGGVERALKVSPDRGDEPSIQGRLDHEHIVPVLSVTRSVETGLRGLCMPYRPGLSLDKVIRRIDPAARPRRARVLWDELVDLVGAGRGESPEDPDWHGFPVRGSYADGVAWLGATLARALGHAHRRGIFHRDVKPANVLLTLRGGPQLLDFNLAHDPHAPHQAEAALRGGTLPYMAPEQLDAFLDPERWESVGAAADLYGLGLVLRELLTGRRPEAPDQRDLPLPRVISGLRDRRREPAPSLRAANPDVPAALDAIVRRCLAFDPADRYPTAEALAEDLERLVRRRTSPLAESYSQAKAAARLAAGAGATLAVAAVASARRHRRALAVAAVVAASVWLAPYLVDRYRYLQARSFFNRAILHAKNEEREAAFEDFERARQIKPQIIQDALNPRAQEPGLRRLFAVVGHKAGEHNDYESARAYLARAIAITKPLAAPRSQEELARLYHSRGYWSLVVGQYYRHELAKVYRSRGYWSIQLGLQVQNKALTERAGRDAGYVAARSYYGQALADLIAHRQAGGKTDAWFHTYYGQAMMGLGDAASHFDDYKTSVKCYREAKAEFEAAKAQNPPDRKILDGLLDEVDTRLKLDEPSLPKQAVADGRTR
jgi:serine/threonine protein kinase